MRLIRTILRPEKSSRQFGRHKVIETSNACRQTVTVKRTDVPGSNGQLRGQSSTASLPSDNPEVKKARRNVSKDERKSMVEKYVHKYMTMNEGKFPTVSAAQKNVGGSYYVVRNIIQEMEYNFKMLSIQSKIISSVEKSKVKMVGISIHAQETPLTREGGEVFNQGKPCLDDLSSKGSSRLKKGICNDTKRSVDTPLSTKASEDSRLLTVGMDSLNGSAKVDLINHGDDRSRVLSSNDVNEEKPLTEVREVSSKFINADKAVPKMQVDDPNSKDLDLNRRPQPLNLFESECSKDIGTQLHSLKDETKGSYQGANVKERTSDELKLKDEEQQLIKSKIPNGVLHEVHSEVTDPESKPSLWQNLKSFANGILGMWRS